MRFDQKMSLGKLVENKGVNGPLELWSASPTQPHTYTAFAEIGVDEGKGGNRGKAVFEEFCRVEGHDLWTQMYTQSTEHNKGKYNFQLHH